MCPADDTSGIEKARPGSALAGVAEKSLLRFLTCGSVDDGKSSLIGRLLYETASLHTDQLAALQADSRVHGTRNGALDYALLVDGLSAEREQGITIDVAYRYFATPKRKFIVADTPGHEQYTRNMATGASTADVAILMIDARKGVLTQTRRHSYIANLLGIRRFVLAVNKMDLVGYSEAVFSEIVEAYQQFALALPAPAALEAIPLSATEGVNVVARSADTPWYEGPSLLDYLETVSIDSGAAGRSFRMPVQSVIRPDAEFRGFSGLIASGSVRTGDSVRSLPSGRQTRIARIVTAGGDLDTAVAGQSVTLALADEIDTSRGDIIAASNAAPEVSDQFQAHLVWMSEKPLLPGRRYFLKAGTKTVTATINAPRHAIDINTLQPAPAKTLEMNQIGVTTLSLDEPIAFDPYSEIPQTGSFILIDRQSQDTVALGLIDFALRRAANIHWQALDISREDHAAQKGQRAAVLWFTGLSGSGKSTIANAVQRELFARGRHSFILDGDNVRHGLNRDLGFTDADRVENIRRVANVARLMADAGLITLVSFISPFRAERQMARSLMADGEFIEIHVDTPLEVAEARDVKGLYRKARAGKLQNFTGIDSPYEPPEAPELRLDTIDRSAEDAAGDIIRFLIARQILKA